MIEFFLERLLRNGRTDLVKLSCSSALEAWHELKYRFDNKLFKHGSLLIKCTIDNVEAEDRIPLLEVRAFSMDYQMLQIRVDDLRRLVVAGVGFEPTTSSL